MSETTAVVEKSLRSVFVGNIPYEATEEKLRDIFSQVGPVLSFKLMYDRESGKPKGYGFCEYKDQETALSAMRNLNGFEIGGRPLRVDNACTEKSRMEMQSLMLGPIVESPFGPDVEPEKAPEAISNAVASLPPEQMYELMRQMKLCVRNNPQEARTMLMNNPQLAYALLQAQVVMRIIDPKMAVQILHGSRDPVEPILPNVSAPTPVPPVSGPPSQPPGPPSHPTGPPVINGGPPIPTNMPTHFPPPQNVGDGPPPMGPRLNMPGAPPPSAVPFPPSQGPPHPVPPPTRAPFPSGDYDLRQLGAGMPPHPRGPVPQPVAPPPNMSSDQDMRMPPGMGSHENFGQGVPEGGRFPRDYDQRDRFRDGPPGPPVPRDGPPPPPRDRDSRDHYPREGRENRDRDIRTGRDSRGPERERDRDKDYRNPPSEGSRDLRGRPFSGQDKDFRSIPTSQVSPTPVPPVSSAPSRPAAPPVASSGPPAPTGSLPPGLAGQDQEKASLIMQVLQLSDDQIRMLPPEQQSSILQLKEQIQRSSH